jgi:hypothetical protein
MAVILASAAALSLGSAQAGAQPAAAKSTQQIDAQKVVADVRRIISENYVLPEVRPRIDAALAAGLAAGHYNGIGDPAALADRINADMAAVAHDKHLGMRFDPAESARLAALPPGAGSDDAPPSAEDMRMAVKFNQGIVQLKVLPGNIRYMDLMGFFWGGPKTAEAYDNAIRFLKSADAVIIDLRHNGGGSPEAVQYLISHFVKPNQPLVTFYMGAKKAQPETALASLPAGRMVGTPLYVLTSGMTASAAEEFTGHVAGYKLGGVVGENTAGAGFRNAFFPVSGGYVISVSTGRAVLASTGKDWEGVGIAPTTKVDADKALDAATALALRRIASGARPDEQRLYEAQAQLLDAKINPVPTALALDRYVGTYGERSITLKGGALTFQRQGGMKLPMVAASANEFLLDGDPMSRVRFTVSGSSVTGLELIRGDGTKVEAQRTQ